MYNGKCLSQCPDGTGSDDGIVCTSCLGCKSCAAGKCT